MPSNNHNPLPLYQQIRESWSQRIVSGQLQPGDKLPTERELAELHGVSQITVKNAIAGLVQQGLVLRRPGLGTIVTKPKVEQELLQLTSFSEDMIRRGLQPGAKVISIEVASALAAEAAALDIVKGEPIIKVSRLRLADDEPMAIEVFAIPQSYCPGLATDNLNSTSLYKLLSAKYNIQIVRAVQQLEPVKATKSEAMLLGIKVGSPLLKIERTSYTPTDQKVEYTRSVYRGDRYKFSVSLSR